MPYLISRENARRMALISCNVAEGYNLGHLIKEVRRRIDPIVHDYGYSVVYGGQFEAQRSASRTLYVMGGAAVLVILLILEAALGSLKAALLVMVNLPLALIGGIIAVYLSVSENIILNTFALVGIGGPYVAPVISIASMIGFITIFGVATRNGILLVNRYMTLTEKGYPVLRAVEEGSMDRLVPILMTALTSGLGLLPIALAAGEPGSELLAPLAIVGLGGLISSTLLNLIVVPVGYALFFRGKKARAVAETEHRA
jgi:HME family heavy-metal exporter